MTSFTGCPKTSLTLPCERSERGSERRMAWRTMDVQETAGAVCGGGASAGEAHGRAVSGVRHLASGGVRVAASLSPRRDRRIAERSRRPQHSPRRTRRRCEEQVIALRHRYPDWGARKLRVLLQREGVELARNTIHRILLRHDLVHPDDRHEPAVQRLRTQPRQRVVADGLQRPEAVAPTGGAAVGAGRPQPLPDCAARRWASTQSELVREQLETAFLRAACRMGC